MVWWRDYKLQSWAHMVQNVANPEVVFFSAATGTNLTLYTIRMFLLRSALFVPKKISRD